MSSFFHAVGSFFGHLAAVNFAALALACALQLARLAVRTRAWRNIIAAAYPDSDVRWRHVLGSYFGGVGLNAITPARGGDVLKLFLLKHRVEASTYPTLAATLVVATRRIQAFWHRVAQGFTILRRPTEYLRRVVTWQALSWVLRLATVYYMLRAFHVPATVHNALLVQIAQSLSTLLPITPGGAGTEQGLLLYLFGEKVSRTALLSFSVGMHIAIVVVNLGAGVAAVALLTRSFRLRKLEREALGDPERAEIRDGVAGTPAP